MSIDPALADVGADRAEQQVVFARVIPERRQALVVARLLAPHPDVVVGRYYGYRLHGVLERGLFRPDTGAGLGEVRWENGQWVQVRAGDAPA